MRNDELHYAITIEKYYEYLQGKPATFTVADWMTIEAWHGLGIPIECVLKGMDRAFSRQHRQINSLDFCDWSVKQACRETCSLLSSIERL